MIRAWLALALALVGSPALAQTTVPPGAGNSPTNTSPPTPDPGIKTPSVIHPGNPDPAMSVAPPQAGSMPVIPPPAADTKAK